jgi:hypothetical protein
VGNEKLKKTIIEVVENQINSLDPPETKNTYDRLRAKGYSSQEAKELIGLVVSSEIFDIMKKKESFNLDRFINNLNKLPEYPDE